MAKRIDYSRLLTEKRNPRSRRLDRLSAAQIVALMNREDRYVLQAMARAKPSMAKGIQVISKALQENGRLFFVGAGTSGRLGVIEAAECPPTFNTTPSQVQAIMAGGSSAVFRSKEGSEDDAFDGQRQIRKHHIKKGDVVVGIAASGVTPFVRAALLTARRRGAKTIFLTCNPAVPGLPFLDVCIRAVVGPELLTGSTRLKSGTACKMALNMLTLGSMARIGKIYGHSMVDLQPKSKKLVARGRRLIRELGRVSPSEAQRLFTQANRQVKAAIVMARKKISYDQARQELHRAKGFLHQVIR